MIIRFATKSDATVISKLAETIWWATYSGLLSEEQISFMLKDMYTEDALLNQMQNHIEFLIAERENTPSGFAGFSMTRPEEGVFKLHKLYVLPARQGKGTGKALLDKVAAIGTSRGARILELNVYRKNPAIGFYKKMGFSIFQEVDIPYHQFTMTDYVMRKSL